MVTIVTDLMTDRFLSNAMRRGLSQNVFLRRPSGLSISLSVLGVSATMPTIFLVAEPGVTIVSFILVVILFYAEVCLGGILPGKNCLYGRKRARRDTRTNTTARTITIMDPVNRYTLS